jgi:hypothetical protein
MKIKDFNQKIIKLSFNQRQSKRSNHKAPKTVDIKSLSKYRQKCFEFRNNNNSSYLYRISIQY